MARLMALDVGEARIGIATCDSRGILASPYTTLYISRNEEQTWKAIQQVIDETETEELIVGLPISLDGQLHTQGQRIQAFAQRLQEHVSIPLTLWDERFSTVEAQRLLAQRELDAGEKRPRRGGQQRAQSKRRRRGHEIDALAATIILQDYLSQHPPQNQL